MPQTLCGFRLAQVNEHLKREKDLVGVITVAGCLQDPMRIRTQSAFNLKGFC